MCDTIVVILCNNFLLITLYYISIHRVGGHMRTPGRIADPLTQKNDIESGRVCYSDVKADQVGNKVDNCHQ